MTATAHTTASATPRRSARGEARDSGVLTLIAVFKIGKAALLVAIACGALTLLRDGDPSPGVHAAERVSAVVGPRAAAHIEPQIAALTPGNLEIFGVGAMLYAAVFAIEGVGLWLGKRWAEYLTLAITASFLPIELYELIRRLTVLRAGALAVNVAVVVYLACRVWNERHAHAAGAHGVGSGDVAASPLPEQR